MWAGTSFDPSKLDLYGPDKKLMRNAVEECLRHISDVSNSDIVRSADGLLSRREVDVPVDWVGEKENVWSLNNLKFLIKFL